MWQTRIHTPLKKFLATAWTAAGIIYGEDVEKGFCFRDSRTSVQSHMEAAGIGAKYQAYFAGHTQEGMDKYYFKLDSLKAQMDMYTTWLDTELEEKRKNVVKSVVNDANQPVNEEWVCCKYLI